MRLFAFIALLFLAGVRCAFAQDMNNLVILTGPQTGTYFQFGENIRTIIEDKCQKPLQIEESAGSLQNLARLGSRETAQLAIVQSDVLDYVRFFEDEREKFRRWLNNYRYVFSLYDEELHIVTLKDAGIRELAQLEGKKVAIGNPESGTKITASFLLYARNVKFHPVQVSPDDALERLFLPLGHEDRVDAFFAVIGKPFNLLSTDDPRLSKLDLVSVDHRKRIAPVYKKVEITPADYEWLDRPVETIAVGAALVTFDFRGDHCENVAMIARQISDNLDELRRFGHNKWSQVDLNAEIIGWQRYECVEKKMNLQIDPSAMCKFVPCDCDQFEGDDYDRCVYFKCPSQ